MANSAGASPGQFDYLLLQASNPPSRADVQTIADKLDELIAVLKRA
jgi:hypothetical protein